MDDNVLMVVISLLLSGFFSATEIAFISANRLHIAIQKKKGRLTGRVLSGFVAKPSMFIATTLIGNTIALVVYGIFMAVLLEPSIEGFLENIFPALTPGTSSVAVLIIQTILSTALVLATAEFLPKSISLANPDKFLEAISMVINVFYWLCFPFTWVVVSLSRLVITKILGLPYEEDKPVFGLTDLSNYITNTVSKRDERIPEVNKEIFNNALEFKKVKVRDCMVPRKEIVAIDVEDGIEELKQVFIKSGHTKILVYKDSIDNIIGYCHLFHLFMNPTNLQKIIAEIIIVPETMLANELMIRFISEHKSIALIVDEFGGTSGIVTIEDIMEEIFGDIEDEHDDEELAIRKIDENNYLLSARHEIEFLNEAYNWQIPEGDYDTLGGFIISLNHDIPKIGDVVANESFRFLIKSMDDARIDMVEMEIYKRNDQTT